MNTNIKDHESNTVLENAHELLGNVTAPKIVTESGHRYYKARFCQLQERMQEAEDILRGLVHDHDSPMPPTLKADVMDMLADILSITGPQAEATSWLERLHTLDVERYGRIHSYTMSSCKKLAFTYSKQRDYERASQFLSKTGRELKESSSQGSLKQLLDRLQQISGWLVKIKGMMIVAKTIELSPPAGTRS